MRINRFLTLLAVLALTAALLPGCGGGSASGGVVPPSPGRSAQEPQSGSGTEAAEPAPATPGESIQTNGGEVISLSALEHQDAASDMAVYYTSGISPEAMVAVYDALGVELAGDNIAVKLSTGEPPASNYLDPSLIADLVHQVDGTIVENNTAYGGQRSSTAMHYQVAEDHGFTDIADFVVLDEDGSVSLPVEGGTQLTENLVGAHFPAYDGYLVLSHFKGHTMAGFGGAIKNISIGMASQEGKCLIHTAGESHTSPWGGEQDPFLESMAEAGKSVVGALDGNILYVSVMNHLSIDCDCDGNPAEPDMHDHHPGGQNSPQHKPQQHVQRLIGAHWVHWHQRRRHDVRPVRRHRFLYIPARHIRVFVGDHRRLFRGGRSYRYIQHARIRVVRHRQHIAHFLIIVGKIQIGYNPFMHFPHVKYLDIVARQCRSDLQIGHIDRRIAPAQYVNRRCSFILRRHQQQRYQRRHDRHRYRRTGDQLPIRQQPVKQLDQIDRLFAIFLHQHGRRVLLVHLLLFIRHSCFSDLYGFEASVFFCRGAGDLGSRASQRYPSLSSRSRPSSSRCLPESAP